MWTKTTNRSTDCRFVQQCRRYGNRERFGISWKDPTKKSPGIPKFRRAREDAYRPQAEDTEYLTRQEMLDEDSRDMGGGTPDLLITNYSMLEYILLRPIEQPLG